MPTGTSIPRRRCRGTWCDSRVNRKWLALELRRALEAATLSVCGPTDCHGCAPFARDCVKGIVADTTGRALHSDLPVLSTPAAPGPLTPALLAAPEARATPAAPDAPAARPRYRYRARFTKPGRMRFLGHLDLTRLVLRALRRADLDLVYSNGFNPKPRVSFGPALAVGIESEAEYVDFEAYDLLALDAAQARIDAALPSGMRCLGLQPIGPGVATIAESVRAARFRARLGSCVDAPRAVDALRARGSVEVRRTTRDGDTRTFDLAAELLELRALGSDTVGMTLVLRPSGASVRPEEVLRALVDGDAARMAIVREELLVGWGGHLVGPMLAAAASDAPETQRALA